MLFGVHNEIRQINHLCLTPLEPALSEAINAINPYKPYHQTTSSEQFENLLLKQEDVQELIDAFRTHPAFDIAVSNRVTLQERSLDYDQTIRQLNNEIVQAGPGGEPQWVKDYEEAKNADHPSAETYRHVAALICLHNSLANFDQLIYHGIFKDELRPLDRSRIVDYFWTTGHVGPSMWLMHISQIHMFVCEPTDLIMVNIDKPGEEGGLGDTLCSVHSTTIPGTNFGPSKFNLWMLDNNLNAYRYLLS